MRVMDSYKMQLRQMLNKKTTIFTYFVVMGFVLVNFGFNMLQNKNIQYVSQMFDLTKKLTISCWTTSGFFLVEYFPLLVIIPTACVWLIDKNTGMNIYIRSKAGDRAYWYGKLMAVFSTTFLVFVVPLLMELVLSCICFSIKSLGDPSNISYLTILEENIPFTLSRLFYSSRILYAIVFILFWGLVAGVFAIFNMSVTTLPIFRYKILAYFPIYVLLSFLLATEQFINLGFSTNHYFYLRVFDTTDKNYFVFMLFLAGITLISIILIERKIRKGEV